MNTPDFAASMTRLINGLGLPYGRDIAGLVSTYQTALADISDEDLEIAVNRWLRRENKFPTVAQLRAEVEAARRDRYIFWAGASRFFLPEGSQLSTGQAFQELHIKMQSKGGNRET